MFLVSIYLFIEYFSIIPINTNSTIWINLGLVVNAQLKLLKAIMIELCLKSCSYFYFYFREFNGSIKATNWQWVNWDLTPRIFDLYAIWPSTRFRSHELLQFIPWKESKSNFYNTVDHGLKYYAIPNNF